ncbi:hypothetical protein AYO44_04325 [Planctomycetaceae bacterium SCGC AG-212-F19]|nr:hypothetical protein AYO44_04325 [Planctomycetaceae bacterium SCGC AG-212-F19]
MPITNPVLRQLVGVIPTAWKPFLRSWWDRFPLHPGYRERCWHQTFQAFSRDQREQVMLSIAKFCHINRPITGYYFEFGCHEANTMRMAWDHFHHLFDWQFVAFDSFAGLPEIQEIDKQAIWEKGKLKTTEQDFIRRLVHHGMQRDRLVTVKGFYDESLTTDLQQRLLPTRAAVVYVDCDLYHSTIPILHFIRPFLQRGTIIVFDDWNCFHGDPDKGERRAFREFRELHGSLRFEPFVSTAELQAFIYLGEKAA